MNDKRRISKGGSYIEVYGMFDFENVYSQMASAIPNDSTLVEVGSAWGKSTLFMMEQLAINNKTVNFHAVDIWIQASDIDEVIFPFGRGLEYRNIYNGETLYYDFLYNVSNSFAKSKKPTPIRSDSTNASLLFEDNSVYFLFLDASHEENKVLSDLNAWYPKVSSGGWIAGHDYNSKEMWYSEDNGVAKAVKSFVKDRGLECRVDNTTFVCRKP